MKEKIFVIVYLGLSDILTSKRNTFMPALATTKMSSKGQIVIPENVRNKLGLRTGHRFIVVGNRHAVVLKPVEPPSMKAFDGLIAQARAQARQAGLHKKDLSAAIARVRDRK